MTEDQILGSTRLAGYIRHAEHKVGHARTVVIGDFNMNPFEAGVVGSEGLHAVMDRRIAATSSRKVQGETRDYFYNPMWANFGDAGSTPPGTYFYDASGREVNYFWNMFDQILVRPALLPCLSTDSVSVVTEIEGDSLLDERGRPDREIGSDHLPVVLRLTEIEERLNDIEELVG
jgi:endonuclease/exonuclease/phosphatase family metal-dependent hydrolase